MLTAAANGSHNVFTIYSSDSGYVKFNLILIILKKHLLIPLIYIRILCAKSKQTKPLNSGEKKKITSLSYKRQIESYKCDEAQPMVLIHNECHSHFRMHQYVLILLIPTHSFVKEGS